jgi:hypothetical protein
MSTYCRQFGCRHRNADLTDVDAVVGGVGAVVDGVGAAEEVAVQLGVRHPELLLESGTVRPAK